MEKRSSYFAGAIAVAVLGATLQPCFGQFHATGRNSTPPGRIFPQPQPREPWIDPLPVLGSWRRSTPMPVLPFSTISSPASFSPIIALPTYQQSASLRSALDYYSRKKEQFDFSPLLYAGFSILTGREISGQPVPSSLRTHD